MFLPIRVTFGVDQRIAVPKLSHVYGIVASAEAGQHRYAASMFSASLSPRVHACNIVVLACSTKWRVS
jgi:hypothetical protein